MNFFRWIAERPRTMVIAVALLVANVIGFARWQQKRVPEYALEQAAEAVRRNDPSAFDTWVDVDKLAASYYDQHLLQARLAANAIDEARRTRDITAIARRLRRWVVTARIDEDETPRLTLLGVTLRNALTERRAHVEPIPTAGRTVIATVPISDHEGRAAKLEIRLDRQRGGTWRISEVTNIAAIIDDLRKSEKMRVDAIAKQLEDAVTFTPPVLKASHDVSALTYETGLTSRSAAEVKWTATCSPALPAKSLSPPLVTFTTGQQATATFVCTCSAATCVPAVQIESVKLRNGTRIARAQPLSLD